MQSITFHPSLRPALPEVNGCKEYREERQLFIRIDELLQTSGLENDFIDLCLQHRGDDPKKITAKRLDSITRHSLIALLTGTHRPAGPIEFGLKTDINFDDIYFDSTCLKAPIHFPVDWVLLRDATRTLMKATALIRQAGHRHRMPQEPLSFLSDINTHCMKMTAKFRTKDGRKHRKAVLRDVKKLSKRIGKRIGKHAKNHLKLLTTRASETELSKGQVRQISYRIQSILDQLPTATKQAHERMIGGRKLPNSKKILSLYDPHVQVLKRGKSGAEVEFGNNLWLGETREGLIVDYLLEKENAWGDRGIYSQANAKLLEENGIRSGLCPRDVSELRDRLKNEPGMREGMKRRAGTEARISIIICDFMGKAPRANGFEHREMMVGWAVLCQNLWVLARLEQVKEEDKIEDQVPEAA